VARYLQLIDVEYHCLPGLTMKTLLAGIAALGVVGLAHGHPLVIEESSRIAPPPGVETLWGDVAIDGDDAVALSFYSYPDEGGEDYWTIVSAHLYRRSGTTWNFVRKLAESDDHSADDATNDNAIAMKDGVLALAFEPMYIFERENGEWVQQQVGTPPGQPSVWHEPASDVEIDGGRIFLGSGSWGGVLFERDSAGNWMTRATLYGDNSGDNDNSVGGDIDLSPNWAVVASPYNADQLPEPAIHVFQRIGTSWPLHARLVPEPRHTFGDFAIRDGALIIGDYARFGAGVWRRDSSSQWYRADSLRTAGDFASDGPYPGHSYGNKIVNAGQYVFQQRWNADREALVVNVFQQEDGAGPFRHVAILVAKDGHDLGGSIVSSGRRVLVSGENGPYYFLLPESFAQPALFQDTFASGNGLGWTALPGSQFSVVQSGNTRVFRQSSTAGNAGAVLDAHDWTHQSIQADVRPTAINGSDRWVGLGTRRTDASNYYYVTLRSSGIIKLKRMQGGVVATLDSASLPWALNRRYRLRLESVGTLHRVYVDGNLVLEAWDDALSHGRAALLSYRAAADYDNVIVSPFLTQTIYSASQGNVWSPPLLQPEPWSYSGTGQWSWQYEGVNNDLHFKQTSTAGTARAAVGPEQVVNTDQIVEARVRPRAFNAAGDPWFGVMARYGDPSNYVYMTLRRSNTVTLRKLRNGSIVQLASAALTVTPDTWYRLRLEAVGPSLRAYVNGRMVLEATDPEPSIGRVGLLGYRTAADYDDIRAVVP
jgi:hypothetical protein